MEADRFDNFDKMLLKKRRVLQTLGDAPPECHGSILLGTPEQGAQSTSEDLDVSLENAMLRKDLGWRFHNKQ